MARRLDKKRVCVVTGSRSEYGLLKPLVDELRQDKDVRLSLLVTGSHLSKEFGLTYKAIEDDGIVIDAKINIGLGSDSPSAIAKSMGMAMSGFGRVFAKLKPGLIVVLGDRFEILAASSSALVSKIPLAHIGGGEITEGAFDDAMRHAITKMSHLHFTAQEEYRKRVIQLGEDPKAVFNVGALGLDNIRKLKLLSKPELEKELGFKFNRRNLLVTFHPVTLEDDSGRGELKNLLSVISGLKETNMLFTLANADPGGRLINRIIHDYVLSNRQRCAAFASLGQLKYLSAMRQVDAVVGNSSSGIFEAPSFRIGTINVGDRQKGRVRAESVIDCGREGSSIKKAFDTLYSDRFQARLKDLVNPYGDGRAAARIRRIIKEADLDGMIRKKFYDIPF